MFPPPNFTVGMVIRVGVMVCSIIAKNVSFCLIWPTPHTSDPHAFPNAVWQTSNELQHAFASVMESWMEIVELECIAYCFLFDSCTCFFKIFLEALLCSYCVLILSLPVIIWGAPMWGWLTVEWCFFHLWIMAPVVLFASSHHEMILAWQLDNIWFIHRWLTLFKKVDVLITTCANPANPN